jgi:hypothetical protein
MNYNQIFVIISGSILTSTYIMVNFINTMNDLSNKIKK